MKKQKQKLIQLVDNFYQKKILVWGDLILDEFIIGNTSRISREAPVLILTYKNKEFSLGGGGNALLNLKALGAEPVPVGIVGEDEAGLKILQILKQMKIPTHYVIYDKSYTTPLKTRILAGEQTARKQQILRMDKETKVPEKKDIKLKLERFLDELSSKVRLLLISDYNYFTVKEDVFQKSCLLYKKKEIPIILDSRYRLLKFKGVTMSTPNEPEVENALKIKINNDEEKLHKAGRIILKKTLGTGVLITRGSRGMVLYQKRKKPFPISIQGTEDIVDVTGAGDTVTSVFSLCLASGASFKQAALLSNYAASVVVMKRGPAVLSSQELKGAIKS